MKLKDKVALITGSASGIGKGIAQAMADEGAKIVLVDINQEKGEESLKELQKITEATLFIKDISKKENCYFIVEEVIKKYGKIDILVNNAHASRQVLFKDTKQEDFDLSFFTGFWPTVNFMQASYEALKASKGKVINFGSGSSMKGLKSQASYAAAKEAIRAISRVTANEWGEDGINVNVISPLALTDGVKEWREKYPEVYQEILTSVPKGRFGDPKMDIGRAAVFLASSDSDFITGQTIMVDGGSILLY